MHLHRPPAASRRRPRLLRGLALAWTLVAVCPPIGSGQAPDTSQEPRFGVYLWTMGQGDEVWELFGHNALVIQDRETGEALAWNWGLFDFQSADFLPRFLRGTMLYSMGPTDPARFLASYQLANRTVYSNRVHLTDEQASALDTFVRWNYREENRHYIYDYYRDNCSTRIRDVLNGILDGALLDHFHPRETTRSYRWHSRRLVQVTWWVDQGLSALLGLRGDLPRTEWEEMFLPMDLLRLLEGFLIEDGAGGSRSLLGPREILFQAARPPEPAEPPGLSLLLVLAGLVGGGLLVLVGWWASEGSVAGRGILGVVATAWGAVFGALGWIMILSWFTDHVFIHWNVNVFYLSPLSPFAAAFLLAALFRRTWAAERTGRWAVLLTAAVAVPGLAAVLVEATRLVQQGNGEVVAVAVPVNVALALAAWRIHREARREQGGPRPPHAEGAVRVRTAA